MKRIYLSLPIKDTGYTTKERMKYADEARRLLELRYGVRNENVIVITPLRRERERGQGLIRTQDGQRHRSSVGVRCHIPLRRVAELQRLYGRV